MLIKQRDLLKIKSAEISILFRQWEKPRVKNGSVIHTSIGQVEIIEILPVRITDLPIETIQKAGFLSLESLIEALPKNNTEDVFQIHVRYIGTDPRILLRKSNDLSHDELKTIAKKLAGMDKRSSHGEWTTIVLQTINDYPETGSAQLCDILNFPKEWFKPQVRKLKNLGLTESLEVGYRISARGLRVLEYLKQHRS